MAWIPRSRERRRLFLEVRPQNSSLKIATDVWALRSALELSEMDASPLNEIVRWVKNERTALIGLFRNLKSQTQSITDLLIGQMAQRLSCLKQSPKLKIP